MRINETALEDYGYKFRGVLDLENNEFVREELIIFCVINLAIQLEESH